MHPIQVPIQLLLLQAKVLLQKIVQAVFLQQQQERWDHNLQHQVHQ